MTILIVPVFIMIVAILLFLLKLRRRFVTVKMTHWLLAVYTCLLLLGLGIAPFMATELPERVKGLEAERNRMYRDLSNGTLENINPELVVLDKTFDYEGESLKIASNRMEGTPVYVERKDTNDGKIEGYVYNSALVINGYNFTDKLAPMDLHLEKNTLTIYYPKQPDLRVSMVQKEFTIKQFNGDKQITTKNVDMQQQDVYLRIPKNVQISNENTNVIFIEK